MDELDRMEEVACERLESLDGSVTALAILKGVLEARKILIGPDDLKTLKTMENLGYWYFRYGWCQEGIALLKAVVDGLENLLGLSNEHTLTAMYKLGNCKWSFGAYAEAFVIFIDVSGFRWRELGKTHKATLETLKQLEQAYVDHHDHNRCPDARTIHEALEWLEYFQRKVRGENNLRTLETMDLLVEHCVFSHCESKDLSCHEADEFLMDLVKRRIPVLRKALGVQKYVLGAIRRKDKILQHA
ncbi:hypothetical protein RUND412_004236 [Rhizina undulata]